MVAVVGECKTICGEEITKLLAPIATTSSKDPAIITVAERATGTTTTEAIRETEEVAIKNLSTEMRRVRKFTDLEAATKTETRRVTNQEEVRETGTMTTSLEVATKREMVKTKQIKMGLSKFAGGATTEAHRSSKEGILNTSSVPSLRSRKWET